MKNLKNILLTLSCIAAAASTQAQRINREQLVKRHNVVVKAIDSLSSLSVGNGKFAYTVDATGMQTFPLKYERGVPLGTQSEWGWHSFKDTMNLKPEESLKDYMLNGRKVSYMVQLKTPERAKLATEWFRQNVHRLQLGNLGLLLTKKDGSEAKPSDIKNINQTLNLWTGEITSSFTFDGVPVKVTTVSHQQQDLLAFNIQSDLVKQGRLKVRLRFPFPTNEWADVATNYKNAGKHTSSLVKNGGQMAVIKHQLDTNAYYAELAWTGAATVKNVAAHDFVLTSKGGNTLQFSCLFSKTQQATLPAFAAVDANSIQNWKAFWMSGGAVDFAGSTDKRAKELERRVILSQYLTKIQCAGSQPPQETGLTYNSWYGKPHLEMHWWHGIHFALWGREQLLEKGMKWYDHVYENAVKIAKRQGYEGARWQKMTDPDGNESPSSVGALLIWQQPHYIYFAELAYRAHPDAKTLATYKKNVLATADFMASFPYYEKDKDRYILGKGVIPAQERYNAEDTFNPTYELQYWYWALQTAQQWRKRLGMQPNKKYDAVMQKLSALPQADGVYLATESAPDSYTNPKYKTDHPSVLGSLGMVPYNKRLDLGVMNKTFDLVWNTWDWQDTWGWDFPMVAMTAGRLGKPDKAVDALFMNIHTNIYLVNGHNYQDDRLRLYLPGNGGLLTAVAMMCAGWDGSKGENPGFPKDGSWKVKWEGLKKMP
ncbi:hypothetical protein [uncultured Mucilaginibacter sp.]|uniref:hypothetical protein n=1 Tax=uncultured Mucilaginibacter sp. TaxID=797541 RepID=UPI0025E955BF|nr:hypothetical protein [uncultured Mucilaginibacter sp.]